MSQDAVVSFEDRAEALLAVVRCGELDQSSSADLHAKVLAAAEAEPDRPVILDMSGVTFVPSVALGELITLTRMFDERSRRFIVVGARAEVQQMLKICHLEKLFMLRSTVEEALREL